MWQTSHNDFGFLDWNIYFHKGLAFSLEGGPKYMGVHKFLESSKFFIDMHHTYSYSQNTYTSVQGYNEV